ncbi:MAG: zinc ribbon domain-containing protein [Eubacteriales bacterium]|nr:zinc ribbon domain-containing protein [Eubacteriales bacterium]
MKSVKPGRGPSAMGFVGSLAAVAFGIVWTIIAAGMTSHSPFGFTAVFPLFGAIFVIVGIVSAVYNYKNARGKDRFSILDITDSNEEGDPSTRWIKQDKTAGQSDIFDIIDKEGLDAEGKKHGFSYCPYCGKELEKEFSYCPFCGKDI